MPRVRYNAITTHTLHDSLTGLWCSHMLTADASTATQQFPCFKFDINADKEFFVDAWWKADFDIKRAAARKVYARFHSWYAKASPLEQILVGIAALTDSSEQLDNIAYDSYIKMRGKFKIEMQDFDGTLFHVDDYHAMRLEDNLNTSINTETIEWWCRCFEEQIRRVIDMPCVSFERFMFWFHQHHAEIRRMENHYENGFRRGINLPMKETRRVFNRSLRLFISMYGENTARKFIKGKNLWIRGKHFVWRLKLLPNQILNATVSPSNVHSPFYIAICDHHLNKLAQACVLFQNTPVLDQAVAFGLSVQNSDDEMDFLRTANIYSFTPEGLQDQLLTSMPNVRFTQYPGGMDLYQALHADPAGAPPDDPSIDDGWPDAPEQDERDNWTREDWHCRYLQRLRDTYPPLDPNDPYQRAFSSEDEISNFDQFEEFQPQDVAFHYYYHQVESRHERRERAMHPIVSRLWARLAAKIDVDPEILEYMRFPELHFQGLPRLKSAPRLEGYIGAKVPLFERHF